MKQKKNKEKRDKLGSDTNKFKEKIKTTFSMLKSTQTQKSSIIKNLYKFEKARKNSLRNEIINSVTEFRLSC